MEPALTLDLIRGSILLCGAYALFASLYGAVLAKRTFRKTVEKTAEPPTIPSRIPFFGHVIEVIRHGFQEYFGQLSISQATPVSVAQLVTQKVYVVDASNTEMTKLFARTPGLSLTAAFWVGFGGYLRFNKASEESMMTPDKHPFKKELSRLIREELMTLQKVQEHGAHVQRKLNEAWRRTVPAESNTVRLAEWVSDGIAMSVGSVIWGDKGPYDEPEFRESLRIMLCGLRELYHPLTLFLPKSFRKARDHVRAGLSTLDAPGSRDEVEEDPDKLSFVGKVKRLLSKYSIPKAGWNDFSFSLIMGVFPNLINLNTWALWHLVADADLMGSIRAEIDALESASQIFSPSFSTKQKFIDISLVREHCPLLTSLWYELLRVYAANSNITRLVTHDSVFSSLFTFRRSALIVAPMLPHQHSRESWGEDADTVRADRFLDSDGKIDTARVKEIMAFGLPTVLMCPGRYVVFNVLMLNIIKTLMTFDVSAAPGETLNDGNGVCKLKKSLVAGVPEPSYDPELLLTRRKGVESAHISFENQKPGW